MTLSQYMIVFCWFCLISPLKKNLYKLLSFSINLLDLRHSLCKTPTPAFPSSLSSRPLRITEEWPTCTGQLNPEPHLLCIYPNAMMNLAAEFLHLHVLCTRTPLQTRLLATSEFLQSSVCNNQLWVISSVNNSLSVPAPSNDQIKTVSIQLYSQHIRVRTIEGWSSLNWF